MLIHGSAQAVRQQPEIERGVEFMVLFIEIALYIIMILQMLYVFLGNIPHEIVGVAFFVLLVAHIFTKRKWLKAFFRRNPNRSAAVKLNGALIICIVLISLVFALSSMGVSRTLFPRFNILQNPKLHQYLATAMLTLSVIHGGIHFYVRSKKKKLTLCIIVILAILAALLGLEGVPYLNRHFKTVDIGYEESVRGDKAELEEMPLVVYFTRIGNTDFDEDVDAVSGASLLKADGVLMGNTELMAHMLKDIIGCEIIPITLKGEKYPSSYSETVVIAGDELKKNARPEIEERDIRNYEKIILIYPLWWGTVPMPVATFLEKNDFTGKTLYLLATQGSSGFGSSVSDITDMAKDAKIIKGLSIYGDDIPGSRARLQEWIQEEFGE